MPFFLMIVNLFILLQARTTFLLTQASVFFNIVKTEYFCSILHPFCWVSNSCSQPAASLFLSPQLLQATISLAQHPDCEELEVWI